MLDQIIPLEDQYEVAKARADIAVTTAKGVAVAVNLGPYIRMKFRPLEDPTALIDTGSEFAEFVDPFTNLPPID